MIKVVEMNLLLSLVPLSISLFIDVCFGYPAKDEFDSKAIFFKVSLFFAINKLLKYSLYDGIYSSFKDNLSHPNINVRYVADKAFREALFSQGRQFFEWEKGLGMCPVCTNIRISILFSLLCIIFYHASFLSLILIPVFSNLYILIFNKWTRN